MLKHDGTNHGDQRFFFKFKIIIINVLDSSSRLFEYVRFWHLKSVPALKGLTMLKIVAETINSPQTLFQYLANVARDGQILRQRWGYFLVFWDCNVRGRLANTIHWTNAGLMAAAVFDVDPTLAQHWVRYRVCCGGEDDYGNWKEPSDFKWKMICELY